MKRVQSSFVGIFIVSASFAQTYVTPVRSDITPPAPQSAAIVAVQSPEPDLLTGAVSISVPIYTVSVDGFQLPVSLQYHSNGIKVFDDPAPLGYGWSLMPALRATRTVMGRPDEHYPFMATPASEKDATAAAYMCKVNSIANSREHLGRYDSEHDIFTFALPNKTVTRVLDASGEVMRFIGADDEEYRVEADKNLSSITVTDPLGVRYVFGGPKEYYHEDRGIVVPTAWALSSIVLDNGRTIDFSWSLNNRPFAKLNWLGGHSFMDNWDQLQWGDSSITQDDFEKDNYEEAIFSRCNETYSFLHLDKISFDGGTVSFTYQHTRYGQTMTAISVNNDTEPVKTYTINYVGDDFTLISDIDGGEGNRYSFSYNTDFGLSPFSGWEGRHAQDWWGYYNAKPNQSLTPDLRVKSYYCTANDDGYYKYNLGNADRSVDTVAMQALILKEVNWPAGGKTRFTYEPHHFVPTRLENNGEIDSISDPYLNYGGGLRVKEITTAESVDDDHALTVQYQYPLATVRAVPSAATFVEVYDVVMPFPDVASYTDDPIARMRMVNIMPMSDYMRYDMGATPLWYDKVTAVWPEGKVETHFKDILAVCDNFIDVYYGGRIPGNMSRCFKGSPALSKQVIFKGSPGNYQPVETIEYEYSMTRGRETLTSCHIKRDIVAVGCDAMNDPDLMDGRWIHGLPHAFGQSGKVEGAYACYNYGILPYGYQLSKKTHTEFTENGEITSTETYTYKKYTELITSVSSTTSEGKISQVTVDYPASVNGNIETAMVNANVVGVPIHEHVAIGDVSFDVRADYIRTSSGAFRQSQTFTVFDNVIDTLFTPLCEYDRRGNLTKVTDADGIAVNWTWDAKGLYPVEKDDNGLVSTFSYKNLVGLAGTTTPYGMTTTFDYDSFGRLVKSSVGGLGIMQTIGYQFMPGDNKITSTSWLDNDKFHTATESYDGLGRKISATDVATGLTQLLGYDNMGRLARTSVPSTDAPASTYDWNITTYEQSPRGLAVSSLKNGEAWHSNDKCVRTRILTNNTSDLSCPMYSVSSEGTLKFHGNYPVGQLHIEETTDENGHVVRSYTNKSGKVVMSEEGAGASDMLRTRYVFDGYGRMRFVLPPSFDDGDADPADDAFVKNCYEFKYDGLGRNVAKRFAGSSAFRNFVYSKAGRLRAEHTPSMNQGEWFVHFYDCHGRLVYTAVAGLLDVELDDFKQTFHVARYVGMSMSEYAGYGFEPTPPVQVDNPFAVAYYDDYGFLGLDGASSLPAVTGSRPGLQTGALDCGAGRRFSAFVYDDWGRIVRKHEQTAKGVATSDFVLDRAGNTLSAVSTLSLRGGSVLNRTQTYTYDNAGRVTDWTVTLGDKTASGSLTYGAFGSVASEKLGNNVERAYTYDCHGWVKGITTSIPNIHKFPDINIGSRFYSRVLDPDDIVLSPLYTDYTETVMYADGVSPRYDGTASSRITTLGGRYDYVFDNHDRLVRADYTPSADANADEDFSTVYAYNSVGAPVSVKRRGITDITKGDDDKITEVFGAMDCLSYDWDGMLLSSVSAEANGTDYLGRTGFSGSAKGGTSDFVWNAAGLLYSDTSRGITRTAYNWAGLPTQITFADGGYLTYKYNADGSVSSVTTYAMTGGRRPTRVSERTYCGDFVFEGDSLAMMNFGSGYFDGDGQPHYRHADWQGSVAMVTDANGKVEQHNGYYPYGEPWREPTGQPYLFGGKERLRDNALNEYDFAARRLQSSLCLWTAPDPLATDYAPTSPYAYCAANPVKFTDPTGKDYKVTLENEMVTISAIIYCTQEAYQTALNAATLITEQSGNFEYSFKNSDGEMVNLPVNFEIEVNIAEQIYTLQNTSKADLSNINVALSKDDRFEKNGLVIQGENFYAKNTKSGESTHNLAKIGKSPNLTQTVAHEFGHMLGFLHSSFGLMTDNASHPSRSDKLDNQNIKESIQSAISGKQRYGQNYNNTGGYAGKGMFDNRSNFNIQEIITGVIKKIKK